MKTRKMNYAQDGQLLRLEDERGRVQTYRLIPLASDCGSGFRLSKIGQLGIRLAIHGEIDFDALDGAYDVNLDGDAAECDCKGFSRWGHCKHVDSLRKLQSLHILPEPQEHPKRFLRLVCADE